MESASISPQQAPRISIRFLGTGTSTGVPAIGCTCPACRSTDLRDKRLRTSAIVSVGDVNLLIDCGPDFRRQIIDAGAPHLDAALLTHSHYDHVGGIDDLRPYCYSLPDGHFPVYCTADVADDLRARVPYCFREHPYPGVPAFAIHVVDSAKPFTVKGIEITPLPVMHDRLPIIGFRIGPMAYITDAKIVPESTLRLLEGVDTLVINALRDKPHHSHMSVGESLEIVRRVSPGRVWFIHMADAIGPHDEVEKRLPVGVHLAYDGLVTEI